MDGQGGWDPGEISRRMRAVERLVPHRLAESLADSAANALLRLDPDASARTGVPRAQVRGLSMIFCLIVAAAFIAPALAWSVLQGAAALAFAVLIFWRLLAIGLPLRWAPSRRLPDQDLPVFTVLAPAYRETGILDQLMRALAALDYPPTRLDIKIVLEADDRDTIAAARELAFDSRFELIIVPSGTPRTKPRALNYALQFARGDIITIYDAEDIPDPDQLRAAAAAFAVADSRLACVQAPLNWYNHRRNPLTRQFALEYAVHFHAILPLLARLGIPLPLGGTSNHIRRDALMEAGGWDAWNVTEDADLGFRLARLGYRSDVIAPPTLEEAPETVARWVRQRSRWLKGYWQTLAVHLRRPGQLPPRAMLGLALTLAAACLSATAHTPIVIATVGLVFAGLAGTPGAALGLLLSGYAASILCSAVAIRRAGLRTRGIDLLSLPLYWPMQTVAAIMAVAELKHRPFFWAKTEHGFSRAAESRCRSPSPSSCRRSPSPLSSSVPCAPAASPIRRKARA